MNGVSILIPVYNEEKILRDSVEKIMKHMKSLKLKYEIIIVSNGSTDKTIQIGTQLEKRFPSALRFFSISERGAVGDAFKIAASKARYNNLVSLDVDLTVEINFIERALKELEEYDIVIGTKTATQERSIIRKIPSLFGIFLINFFLWMNFSDYSIGAKAFRKKDIIDFLPKLHKQTFYIVELLYYAKRKGLKVKEITVKCVDLRESKFNIKKEILYRLFSILRFWTQLHLLKTK